MHTLETAITEFLSHCQFEKNLSPKTIKAYQIDLFQLNVFLNQLEVEKDISQISKIEIRAYLEHIASLKPKSIKRKVAAIKTMFNFLEFEDRIVVNPLRKMKINIKQPKILPKVLNLTEVHRIFKSAYKEFPPEQSKDGYGYFEFVRNITVIELLFGTGARVSEIANLKVEDIDVVSGKIMLKGKGSKERIIQICHKESLAILKRYRTLCANRIQFQNDYFLINRLGRKLSDQSVRGIVKKICEQAGIEKHITPHCFRHTFATLLLEKDVDIKYIQQLLGHSSIMTTQIYTHVSHEKQRSILKTKHPRRDFQMPELSELSAQ